MKSYFFGEYIVKKSEKFINSRAKLFIKGVCMIKNEFKRKGILKNLYQT